MRVPISWLKEYVEVAGSTADLAKALIMAGVGVEAVEGDVLDLEITANRADLLSILGVAREVGVIRRVEAKRPDPRYAEGGDAVDCAVEVPAQDLCPRYTARRVRGVKIAASPGWLAERLEAAGIRPVNNVVDVTNFVLLESGQPLHAFDAACLKGGKIVVRRATKGEKMTAIDAKAYGLNPDTLVIADAERPVAIAGVMGGKDSEIGGATTDVIIESAQFDPVSVRRTSRRLGLSSESSYRFERGVDFDTVDWASRRAVQLILELAGGSAAKGVEDVHAPPPARASTRVRPARISKVLGMDVPPARVREILTGLGCLVGGTDSALEVASPPGRRDLRIEVDYIEEVARIEGYEKIPCDTGFGLRVSVDNAADLVREETRAALAGLGGYEVVTWSFTDAKTANRVSFWTPAELVPLRDPQGQVDRTLRESLAPGLLKVLQTNEAYKEDLHPVFEIADVYRKEKQGFGEKTVLGLAVPGDPLGVKGILQTLFGRLGLSLEIVPADLPFLRAGTAAEIRAGGRAVGYLGAPGAGLSDLRASSAVAEVDFEAVVSGATLLRPYKDFNRQPPVARDLNVLLADTVTWRQVEETVRAAAPPSLEAVRFLSEYRGKGVEPGHRALAFSMLFRMPDRTLTSEEVEESLKAILGALGQRLGARLR